MASSGQRAKFSSLSETSVYLGNSFVYLGKEPNWNGDDPDLVQRLGKSGAVIPKLMGTLLHKGYRLYEDNWYTSQVLFNYLHENNTAACGTAERIESSYQKRSQMPHLQKESTVFGDMMTYWLCGSMTRRK